MALTPRHSCAMLCLVPCWQEADVDSAAALMTYYLAAIVHDFEHR